MNDDMIERLVRERAAADAECLQSALDAVESGQVVFPEGGIFEPSHWTGGQWCVYFGGWSAWGADRDETCAAALAKYVRCLVDLGGGVD